MRSSSSAQSRAPRPWRRASGSCPSSSASATCATSRGARASRRWAVSRRSMLSTGTTQAHRQGTLRRAARPRLHRARRERPLWGQSGVGKTMLAQNLGQAALEKGYTVRLTTLAAALSDLLKQESMPAFERRLRRHLRPDLLILDELGYVPCDSRSGDLLYNIINRRHETSSTVITIRTSASSSGAPSFPAPPVSSRSSTASRGTCTPSRSTPSRGARRRTSRPRSPRRRSDS